MSVRYKGLYIVNTTAFLRPVQIVRQTISNLDMGISPLWAYHNYKGLSSLPQNGGGSRRIANIPIGITNPISLMRVYVDIKVWDKRFDK